jgi:hypothetical protein
MPLKQNDGIKVSFSKREMLLLDFLFTHKESDYFIKLNNTQENRSHLYEGLIFATKTRGNFFDILIEELNGVKRAFYDFEFTPNEYFYLLTFINELIEGNDNQKLLTELRSFSKKMLVLLRRYPEALAHQPLKEQADKLLKVC